MIGLLTTICEFLLLVIALILLSKERTKNRKLREENDKMKFLLGNRTH